MKAEDTFYISNGAYASVEVFHISSEEVFHKHHRKNYRREISRGGPNPDYSDGKVMRCHICESIRHFFPSSCPDNKFEESNMTVHETLMTRKGEKQNKRKLWLSRLERTFGACTKTVSATISMQKFKLALTEKELQMTNLVSQCIDLMMVLGVAYKISRHTYTNWKQDQWLK